MFNSTTLTAITAALGLVSAFAPLVPEVVSAIPTIVSDAEKAAADVKSLDASASIADLENILKAVPADAVEKVITASKGLTL
jgi:hypothetical protein